MTINLSSPISRAMARARIAELNLPPWVTDVFDGKPPSEHLEYRAKGPSYAFTEGTEVPEGTVPLWECGIVITAWLDTEQVFVQFELEAPDEIWWRFRSFDAVIADLLIDIWEDEISRDDLTDVARTLGFTRIDELLGSLESKYERKELPKRFDG